jgi:3-hydroxyacyl-CoA dehydrogenase
MTRHIGIVGAGLVGSGWAIVFARAGQQTRLYDSSEKTRAGVLTLIEAQLQDLESYGLVGDVAAIMGRIQVCKSLDEAVAGARYVQESVLEEVAVKSSVSAAIAASLSPGAVVGSSTSGIPASAFTENIPNRDRFLVSHPINPPYLAPIVELVPAPWTDPDAVEKAMALMTEVGQSPVLVKREIEGFILNRLQGVLLREAWALFEEGYASAADIDKTVSEGLGLRWSFMGPFETIDLNAPGGVADYARRLGPLYHSIQASRSEHLPWSDSLIEAVDAETREKVPMEELTGRRNWRDRRMMALAAHKMKQEKS